MSGEGSISVIVPARNEQSRIGATLRPLREPEVREVIVIDGKSEDDTVIAAGALADSVLSSAPGRARQMNAGARASQGRILFFLHADTLVPPGFASAIVSACKAPDVVGGRFDVEIDGAGLTGTVIAAAINLRSRWTGAFTGDQGLFIRREAFERLGGFPEIPIFEDLEMSLAMKRIGRVACLRQRLVTSGRRWRHEGVLRTVLLMWTLRGLRWLGMKPDGLARLYRDVR